MNPNDLISQFTNPEMLQAFEQQTKAKEMEQFYDNFARAWLVETMGKDYGFDQEDVVAAYKNAEVFLEGKLKYWKERNEQH